jgi:chromosome segregation ATPase
MRNSGDLTTQPTATAIMERLQNFETRVAQEMDTLGGRVERQIHSLKEDIGSLKGDVSSLKGDVSSLKGEMSSLKGEVSSLKGEMSSLKGEMSSLKDEVKKGLAIFSAKIDVLNEDTLSVRAGQRDILKRMNELEVKTT